MNINLNNKSFKPFGVASELYDTETAKHMTYTTRSGELAPTPLIFKENPYSDEIKNLKYIFEIGCGVGRNIKWVLDHTDAVFISVEPNLSMIEALYNIYPEYKDNVRVLIYSNFTDIKEDIKFDLVLSTFVFQHICYMPDSDTYNVKDIASEISKYAHDNTIWILLEHDGEDNWIDRFINDCNIKLDVYIRNFKGIEELTHRDHCAPNGHHLMIFKGEVNDYNI